MQAGTLVAKAIELVAVLLAPADSASVVIARSLGISNGDPAGPYHS